MLVKQPGVVSLEFRELSRLISQKYTLLETSFFEQNFSWNFMCTQSMHLSTCKKFNLDILTSISAMYKLGENILESSQNVSETSPGLFH